MNFIRPTVLVTLLLSLQRCSNEKVTTEEDENIDTTEELIQEWFNNQISTYETIKTPMVGKDQRTAPDTDENQIESKLHIVYSAAKWLTFYRKNGHGYEAYF
ncbi:hypothetical protein [Zobellia laminariae]|uniref:hypothetical protein n=1 Tax=Zobellia laminariae TaxID=248906 RepID=UPI0026F40C1E|nr:hypothetical protein [Zobellia laminariae]WKX74750.1 hypothetical protein Q5W13_13140 [Zobellia laminariae]